jgi:Mg2+/citrate symporter
MIHGMGGHCAYAGYPTLYQQAVIATGGVLAQLILLAIAVPIVALVPLDGHLAELSRVLTYTNVMLILFNLIPIQPLDGHLILQLPGLYARSERDRLIRAAEEQERRREREAIIVRARAKPSGIEPVDERAVKDLVQRALEDAKRAAKDRAN